MKAKVSYVFEYNGILRVYFTLNKCSIGYIPFNVPDDFKKKIYETVGQEVPLYVDYTTCRRTETLQVIHAVDYLHLKKWELTK